MIISLGQSNDNLKSLAKNYIDNFKGLYKAYLFPKLSLIQTILRLSNIRNKLFRMYLMVAVKDVGETKGDVSGFKVRLPLVVLPGVFHRRPRNNLPVVNARWRHFRKTSFVGQSKTRY